MNTTKYTLKVPKWIDPQHLDQLLRSMDKIFNTSIETTTEISVETTSKRALDALQTIFRTGNGTHPEEPVKKASKTKPKQSGGVRSWTVVATGDKISTQALNKQLAEKEIEIGTKLHHPKHGDRVVSEAYELVDPGKWHPSGE